MPPAAKAVPLWLAYLTRPGDSHAVLALPGVFNDPEYGVEFVICRFGPVPERGGLVLVVHHALLPRSAALLLDAPATPSATTELLAEPATLGGSEAGDVRVWHSGALRVGGLLHTHLEATADRPGLLAGPLGWELSPDRPSGTPRPLEVGVEPRDGYRHGSGSRGEQHSTLDALLTASAAEQRIHWTCHPLGLTGSSTISGS
ncbi:hypothetical protein ACFVXG_45390 [Kitasatospora sp. NPDC058162]|uniref:hypothetical protein n=1 Tax=Kitasatospora sp. NPDC058162 TaxID=3346362 RepID=UPI0036DDFEB2